MTMGDESVFAAMTVPVVIIPILESLEQKDFSAAQTLKAAFTKVEENHQGFAYDLVSGVLRKAGVESHVDMPEALLRLEASNDSNEFKVSRTEEPFKDLNIRSSNLKKILSRIPDEIYNRQSFLETIKDIAGAIKKLLDAVTAIFIYIEPASQKQSLEVRKREFVKYSKRFSNTLKEFFRDNQKREVFISANLLINQTNLIMQTVKAAC